MNRNISSEYILLALCTLGLLGLTAAPWPYAIYILLRVLVCVVSIYLTTQRYQERRIPWVWVYFAIAVLFNPVLPVRMARADWQIIDLLTAAFFGGLIVYSMSRSEHLVLQNHVQDQVPPVPQAKPDIAQPQSTLITPASDGLNSSLGPPHNSPLMPPESDAHYNLGWSYAEGHGVDQDNEQAELWFRKAADQGDARAQCRLGDLIIERGGTWADYDQAAAWFRKAAVQGNADAQFFLSVLYAYGRGVEQDYALSVRWCRMAAEQGHATAQCYLGWRYTQGRGVTKDYNLATIWFQKAALMGCVGARYSLIILDGLSHGVERDPTNTEQSLMTRLGFKRLEDMELWFNLPDDPVARHCRDYNDRHRHEHDYPVDEDYEDTDEDAQHDRAEPVESYDGKESEHHGVELPPWITAAGFASPEEQEQSGIPYMTSQGQVCIGLGTQYVWRFDRSNNPEGEVRAWAIRNQGRYRSFSAFRTPGGDVVLFYAPNLSIEIIGG